MDDCAMNSTNNWRSTTSEDALKLILNNFRRFGISRIANITHLDILGFPVYIGLRPRGKTLSVSAGKGLTHVDSIVSAAMESIEIDVAENVDKGEYHICSYNELPKDSLLPFEFVPPCLHSVFDRDTVVSWIKLQGLNSGRPFYYPASLVVLDKQYIHESIPIFPWSSNGLASGITFEDAVLSGLYEVIERDSFSCWEFYHRAHAFPLSSIIESTIPFASTKLLLQRIRDCSLDYIISPFTSDIGIPVYRCLLLNRSDQSVGITEGSGCHHNDEIAINRAITEAAQARAVFISGSRDDIFIHALKMSDGLDISAHTSSYLPVRFASETYEVSSPISLVDNIVHRTTQVGMHEPLIFRFKGAEPFSVVRVIMPSLVPSAGRLGQTFSRHMRLSSFKPTISGINALFF